MLSSLDIRMIEEVIKLEDHIDEIDEIIESSEVPKGFEPLDFNENMMRFWAADASSKIAEGLVSQEEMKAIRSELEFVEEDDDQDVLRSELITLARQLSPTLSKEDRSEFYKEIKKAHTHWIDFNKSGGNDKPQGDRD